TIETIDTLANAAGIAPEWWNVSGKRTLVSAETKLAFLGGLGVEVGSEDEARGSLPRLIDDTDRRRLPFSLVLRQGEALTAPLRDMARAADARLGRGERGRNHSTHERA